MSAAVTTLQHFYMNVTCASKLGVSFDSLLVREQEFHMNILVWNLETNGMSLLVSLDICHIEEVGQWKTK